MISTIEECRSRLEAFADTPELLTWLDDMYEESTYAGNRYQLGELRVSLQGLYDLARSQHAHLFGGRK